MSSFEQSYLAISSASYYIFIFNVFAQFFHFATLTVWLVYACYTLNTVIQQIKAAENSECDTSTLNNFTNRQYELILFIVIALIEIAYFLLNLFLTLFVATYTEPIQKHPSYLALADNCTLSLGSTIGEAYNPGLDNFVYTKISPIYDAFLLLLVWVIYLSIWRKNLVLTQSLLYQPLAINEERIYQYISVGIIQGSVFVFLNFNPLTLLGSYPVFCILLQINLILFYREFRRFRNRYTQWLIELKRDRSSQFRRAVLNLGTYKILVPCVWWPFQFYFLRYVTFTLFVWIETLLSNTCFLQTYGIHLNISLTQSNRELYQLLLHIVLLIIQVMRSLFYLLLATVYVTVLCTAVCRVWKQRKPIPRYRLGAANNIIRTY